jgi:hypothetical protein
MPQTTLSPTPLFDLGEVRITPGAEAILSPAEIVRLLHRHQHGEYGDLDEADIAMNNRGASRCCMVMSAYRSANGTEVWVKTHGTRSHTLIMLPGE